MPASQQTSRLAVRSARTRCVLVPLTIALGTSAAVVRNVPLLLLDLATGEGVVGKSYIFCYSPANARAIAGFIADAVELVRGQPAAPADIARKLGRRFALIGVTGSVRAALSAIDIALWDALGRLAGQPLATLLGANLRPLPAYDSRGLGLMAPEALAAETELLRAKGLRAVKLRLGYPTLSEDLTAVRTVRQVLPEGMPVMVDYNQALSPAEAVQRGHALAGENIYWLEEPIRHDDYPGNALIARSVKVPLQIGENFNGPYAMLDAIAAGACTYVMPDVARIGGVTGWMQAAGIAAAKAIEMSSHLMPEISAHLLAASPTRHWLEYVDWADAILEEPMRIADGCAIAPEGPGLGFSWDEAKIGKLDAL